MFLQLKSHFVVHVYYFFHQKDWAMTSKQAPINNTKKFKNKITLKPLVFLTTCLARIFFLGWEHPLGSTPAQSILVVGASLCQRFDW